ncbi:aspartate/glutamate racemase family protein [uncultured Maritalea sp.]|uniref:aspartate/glutamate racemase family protein n=1 Tax=uncultured Maritalea sp. TaxID=757249 RepID=UPI0026138C38|nr:aspartate/glutamate racemase family protein [uncultured Maritalea sp.]
MTKIMYFSPVAHRPGHDELFANMVREFKDYSAEVHVTCLPDEAGKFNHVEFRSYEAMVTPHIIRGVRAAAREGFDALVIGCFYDTALKAAQEISGDMIVTAPCVASCDIASSLSNQFGIIVGRQKWVDQMHSTVHDNGYGRRLTGFYPAGLGVTEFQKDHNVTARCLKDAARIAVENDHAEALVLGCTMEIGFYKELEKDFGVPVFDPAIAAFRRAQNLANLKKDCGWKPSRKWSCEAPPESELEVLKIFDQGNPFGNRIVIPAQNLGEKNV